MHDETAQTVVSSLRDYQLSSTAPKAMQYYGTSMLPLIQSGDIIDLKKVAVHELSFGDIVAYERNGRILVNRFFCSYIDRSKHQITLVIKGDNRHTFRRTRIGSYLGHVSSVRTSDGTIVTRSVIARVFFIVFAILSGLEGSFFRVFRLNSEKSAGITIIAKLLAPFSTLLKSVPWTKDVPH